MERKMRIFVRKGLRYIKKFDPLNIDFDDWLVEFENVVRQIHLPEKFKISFLWDMMVHPVAEINKKILAPLNHATMKYADIVNYIKRIYDINEPDEQLTKLRFYARVQGKDEPIDDYLEDKKTLFLKSDIRDKDILTFYIVSDLSNEKIRTEIRMRDLDFEETVRFAKYMDRKLKCNNRMKEQNGKKNIPTK